MSRSSWAVIVAAVLVAVGLVGIIIWRHGKDAAGDDDKEPTPTAQITTARLASAPVSPILTLYGEVAADPAQTLTIASPSALIVSQVLVRPGQPVAAGQALVKLMGSAESEHAFAQATTALSFAQEDLARIQRLFDQKLASSDQLSQARKAVADGQQALEALNRQEARGVTLTAPKAGVVAKLLATPGDHVAQDAALLNLASRDGLTAALGVEPGEHRVAAGEAVTLKPAGGAPAIVSRIGLVGQAADPDSKRLTASAALKGTALPIGAPVVGEVALAGHEGLLAPRASVVFDETGTHLFTIADGKAHRVFVTAGADQGDQIEVTGPVKAGDVVAVVGAYELQDGMAVKTR